MSNIVLAQPLPPAPRCGEINVRSATIADLPFIDSLQKMHTHMVGWMPTKSLEAKIANGHMLVAEESEGLGLEGLKACQNGGSPQASKPQASKPGPPAPLGTASLLTST